MEHRLLDENARQLWQINKYLWMSLAFVLLYLPIATAHGLFTAPAWVGWLVFGAAVAEGTARSLFAWRLGGRLPARWAWLCTYLDIALISLAIGITRGIESDLWLLYFVVMIFESLNATPREKRLLDAVMIAGYLLATLPYQFGAEPAPMSLSAFFRILATRLFFLIVVSALGRRISVNTMQKDREVQRLREQMAVAGERARIAREIHDGLGHALVSSILRLELCARLIRTAPEEAEALLREEVPALRAAWNEGRDLAFHLRPWETDASHQGELVESLRRHIGRFAERTGLSVDFQVEGEPRRLRPEVAFSLTRIVQEALTNAARHAQATTLAVRLAYARAQLTCEVCDDGRGFEPEAGNVGFGLLAMRERAEAFGGQLILDSAPGQGTRLRVTVPL